MLHFTLRRRSRMAVLMMLPILAAIMTVAVLMGVGMAVLVATLLL